MNTMRKLVIILSAILIFILVLVGIGVVVYNNINQELEGLNDIEIEEIDLSNISDGTYIGKHETSIIKVKVSVTILNHVITNIEILKHDNGQGGDANTIIDDVILEQSVLVDSIAGATYSSKVIILAIIDALS